MARQFNQNKNEIGSQLKGLGTTDLQMKDAGDVVVLSSGNRYGLKEVDSNPSVSTSGSDLLRRLNNIQVPPPILPDEAVIGFGQLAKGDEQSKRILKGFEGGVALAQVYAKVKGIAWPAGGVTIVFIAGKSFIAAEDAADVYIVKRNDVYEQALAFQKNPKSREQFGLIVRALREHQPLGENVSVSMVKAAQAILDPALGNSSARVAWNAMLSPEARHAALTRACIETGAAAIGGMADTIIGLRAVHDPPFKEAETALQEASAALAKTQNPAEQAAWHEVIKKADYIITHTWMTGLSDEMQSQGLQDIFISREEKIRTKQP
jgi:hypothetical protein